MEHKEGSNGDRAEEAKAIMDKWYDVDELLIDVDNLSLQAMEGNIDIENELTYKLAKLKIEISSFSELIPSQELLYDDDAEKGWQETILDKETRCRDRVVALQELV